MGLIGEVIVRSCRLVPDIPARFIDDYGIQRYKPRQSGFYSKIPWRVNDYGWIGTSDLEKDTIISIIGDSYIENMMNPLDCNQGFLLKLHIPDCSFFEAGRSGMTFIEAMEVSKILDVEVSPKLHLLYLNEADFYESIADIKRYPDRFQLSIDKQLLLKGTLKSPGLKKILYNLKLLYYLYLKYPIFIQQQNKGLISHNTNKDLFDESVMVGLFDYCSNNYDVDKLVFVLHPHVDSRIIKLIQDFRIRTIVLEEEGGSSWRLGSYDDHWSCYGHKKVSEQVKQGLLNIEYIW